MVVFAFETRNPLVRRWEEWIPAKGYDFIDATGTRVRWESNVETPVVGDVVRFTTRYTSRSWDSQQYSSSTLRFLDAKTLASFLTDAGLVIEQQFGDWDRQPFSPSSPEIITIATRRGG
ncbi:MAG: hypothetical protein ABR509_03515 [Candidatus Limnocylindria bacterium]